MDITEFLHSARSIDVFIKETKQKYEDKPDFSGEQNWLLDLALLNFGTDFLHFYETALKLQETLKDNVGRWGYDLVQNAGLDCRVTVFQVSSRLLVPGQIQKLPLCNPDNPGGFDIDLSFGIEPEYLGFDKEYGLENGFARDPEGGIIHFHPEEFNRLGFVQPDYFRTFNTPTLMGSPNCCHLVFGETAERNISYLLQRIGYDSEKESPLDCIRRQEGKKILRREDDVTGEHLGIIFCNQPISP